MTQVLQNTERKRHEVELLYETVLRAFVSGDYDQHQAYLFLLELREQQKNEEVSQIMSHALSLAERHSLRHVAGRDQSTITERPTLSVQNLGGLEVPRSVKESVEFS
jgi:hydroxypyruvate isomerase